MRDYIITAFVVMAALIVVASCTKANSYKSYTCVCILQVSGETQEEYGVEATDRYNAGIDCADIEDRVNKFNQDAETNNQVNCSIK